MLSGCTNSYPVATDDDACGALALGHLVGGPVSAFDPKSVSVPVRMIGPDTAVTMDYNPMRMNVQHSKSRIIESITCG